VVSSGSGLRHLRSGGREEEKVLQEEKGGKENKRPFPVNGPALRQSAARGGTFGKESITRERNHALRGREEF